MRTIQRRMVDAFMTRAVGFDRACLWGPPEGGAMRVAKEGTASARMVSEGMRSAGDEASMAANEMLAGEESVGGREEESVSAAERKAGNVAAEAGQVGV